MWRQDPVGKALPVAGCGREKALPDARWRAGIRRAQEGPQRKLQHGRYTAETIATRRRVSEKIREVRTLTKSLQGRL